MATSISKKKVRVELWFTTSESRDIRKYLCKDGEKRKVACERIIRAQLSKTISKHQTPY